VVGIFPDRTALIRLVGVVLAKQHDEWAEGRRYLGLDALARARITAVSDRPSTTTEGAPTSDIPALSARQQPEDHASPANTTPGDLTLQHPELDLFAVCMTTD